MTARELYIQQLEIDSRSEMLHSLLEIMRISLPEAEESDIDMTLLLAGELAGKISFAQKKILKSSKPENENSNGK